MLIQNSNHLADWLKSHSTKTVRVTTKIRKCFLIQNNYVVREGKHYEINFKNIQGGVWEACLKFEKGNRNESKGDRNDY